MDSKDETDADGHLPNTTIENSEGGRTTSALQKRRARRVSFAEMTSVHFFDRDEDDNETHLSKNVKDYEAALGFGGQAEQGKESEGEDDADNGDDDDEVMQMRGSFLRPIGSPSPGGSSRGSVSSYDEEDNFFGPVSANFIRPGRLSDTAASDDNHDATMDSMAFSIHFQSLARSESGVDLRTPTGVQLFAEEKTPNNTSIRNSMSITSGHQPVLKSSTHASEVSGSHDSDNMSLLVQNPKKYAYDELQPEVYALLAEGKKCELYISGNDDNIDSALTGKMENAVAASADEGNSPVNVSDSSRKESGVFNSKHLLNAEVFVGSSESDKPNGPPATPSNRHCPDISSSGFGSASLVTANEKPNESLHQSNNIECAKIPMVVAASSTVNQLQALLFSISASEQLELTSPLIEQPVSFLRNEYSECYEGQTSIQKSISKLELLEKSAFSSTLNRKVDLPTIKSLDLKSPNLTGILKENRHVSEVLFAEDSFIKEKFPGQRQGIISSLDIINKGETLEHMNKENNLEGSLGLKMIGQLPNDLRTAKISTDQPKYRELTSSPSGINWPNNLKRSLFPFKQSGEDALMTETEALSTKIGPAGQKNIAPPKFSLSPGRMSEKKISASPALYSSQRKGFLPENRLKLNLERERSEDSFVKRIRAHPNSSTGVPDTNAAAMGTKGELCSASVELSHVQDLVEVKATGNKDLNIFNEKETFGTIANFVSPAKENKSQFMYSKSLMIGNQSTKDTSGSEEPAGKQFQVRDSVSSSALYLDLIRPRFQNLAEFPAASPSKKQLGYKDSNITSPKSTILSDGLEKFSADKRKIELLLKDDRHRIDTSMMQRSPKFQKAGNSDPSEDRKTLIEWTDIFGQVYSKFSEDMEQLVSKLTQGLGNKMIAMLEDTLVCRQKSQLYEILCSGIMPQNAAVHDLRFERIVEANQLLQKILFEKAMLQLKHVKRERLLKRLQLASSKIQELQLLRTKISPRQLKTSDSVQVLAVGDLSFLSNLSKAHEVSHDKLAELRLNLEALEGKILNLEKTFHTSCKMKFARSCKDTIASVNEYLMKKAYCRFIRMDMQMWVVYGVKSMSDQYIVVLKYLDFIIQSIKVTVCSSPSQTTSYELNETSIAKTFPNMDACTVFSFVFNAGSIRKYIGAKTLVQETQVNSSILGTLLDVLEEMQLAQLECRNLTQSRFCFRSGGQLALMLCFMDFKTGRKVILTLDMSCLKCGVYPSETIPLELGLQSDDKQKYPLPWPIYDEIRDAVKGLKSGYLRILWLCRCVSEVVRAASS